MNVWVCLPSARSTNMLKRTVTDDVPRHDVRIKMTAGKSVIDM